MLPNSGKSQGGKPNRRGSPPERILHDCKLIIPIAKSNTVLVTCISLHKTIKISYRRPRTVIDITLNVPIITDVHFRKTECSRSVLKAYCTWSVVEEIYGCSFRRRNHNVSILWLFYI